MSDDTTAAAGEAPAPPLGRVEPRWGRVAVFTGGLSRIPHLDALLGAHEVVTRPRARDASGLDAVIGWGNKPTIATARAYARRHGLAFWRAEDGFLRSIGLGRDGAPPLSIVLDDRGIYYDARTQSRLETLLAGDTESLDQPALINRARRAMARIVSYRLSKYNNTDPRPFHLPDSGRARVLVVDQTAGDLSIEHGLAGVNTFARMLEAALREHPDADILVKTHPDVVAGHRRGCVPATLNARRVTLIAGSINPIELLTRVDRVYAVTSQLGFEALLAGTPVTTFGAPFYAGWGLTDDRRPMPRPRSPRSLEQLFAAAYLLYARYLDPETGRPGQLEDVIDHLARQREIFAANQGAIFCVGFRAWKHGYVRAYLRCPGNRIQFVRDAAHARTRGFDAQAKVVAWGQRAGADVEALAAEHGVPIWRMEDGFLRSVGLGSDLVTPASLVVDRHGVYYDPRTPSDLELILENGAFSPDELARARALRETMVREGLSKYNVGHHHLTPAPPGARVVLVPGQVEDDASIQLGCPGIRRNEDLIRAARAAAPDAFLIYKPHPDVVAGNRQGAVDADVLASLCDRVELDAAIADCLGMAHEVHTLTSLVGFEALLRGLPVVVHGQPFYSGWGLTEDHNPLARRRRRLTLDELVAGTLIRYPRYLHPTTRAFTTPEAVLTLLRLERSKAGAATRLRTPWARRQLRKLIHLTRGMLDAT
ncbi:capsular polysaccharide biosynthesis protein [Haliangium sp.]|uniref:capsular polysaccharide biosynthesis protein n=1 Tax=Haliangium sp. TaxID=2663208 RepID=UPI003D1493AB